MIDQDDHLCGGRIDLDFHTTVFLSLCTIQTHKEVLVWSPLVVVNDGNGDLLFSLVCFELKSSCSAHIVVCGRCIAIRGVELDGAGLVGDA